MLPQILAMTVTDTANGKTVDMGTWPFIVGALPFVVTIVLIVMLAWYFLNKKRFEHQQIMAAIEKGTPLSELRPLKQKGSNWIINITAGIAFLLIGIGTAIIIMTVKNWHIDEDGGSGLFFALIFLAIGISRLIRGILQRKDIKHLSLEKSSFNANQGQ